MSDQSGAVQYQVCLEVWQFIGATYQLELDVVVFAISFRTSVTIFGSGLPTVQVSGWLYLSTCLPVCTHMNKTVKW